jgi:hypothetical protein
MRRIIFYCVMVILVSSCSLITGMSTALPGYFVITSTDSKGVSSTTPTICPLGYYCINGVKTMCPGGTFGAVIGLSNASCSGVCPEGWFCPPASARAKAHFCLNYQKIFCPVGSDRRFPTGILFFAFYYHRPVGGGFGAQQLCPPGSYCLEGIRNDCPGGYYGSKKQETNSTCTNICPAGFFCPPGTSSYAENKCTYTPVL